MPVHHHVLRLTHNPSLPGKILAALSFGEEYRRLHARCMPAGSGGEDVEISSEWKARAVKPMKASAVMLRKVRMTLCCRGEEDEMKT